MKTKAIVLPVVLAAILGLAGVLEGVGRAEDGSGARGVEPVTVLIVRHAETDASTLTDRDPHLSDTGRARARELARLLSRGGVTHLFSSEYGRTAQTLAPLAEELDLGVETVPARDAVRQADLLRSLPPGSVAVVAGHSNTVPGLVTALGGVALGLTEHPQHGPMLAHEEYDRLFVVTLPVVEGGAAKALELRYGSREESSAR